MKNILIVTLIGLFFCSAAVKDGDAKGSCRAEKLKQEKGSKKPARPKPLYRQIFMI